MASNEAVIRSMLLLSDAYPSVKFSDTAAEMWAEILMEIPDEALAAATKDAVSSPEAFCPSVGQLRHAAFDLMEPGTPSGAEAWELIARWFADPSVGTMPFSEDMWVALKAVCGDHWSMNLAVREGREKIGPIRSAFIKVYDGVRERHRREKRMHPTVKEVAHGAQNAITD